MNELDKIQEYTQQILSSLLFETNPEYKNIFNINPYKHEAILGNYLFMNEFATVLAREIEKDKLSIFVSNSFKYINMVSESNNLEVLNILKIGILEILYTSGVIVRDHTLEQLSDKNKIFFLNFSSFYL